MARGFKVALAAVVAAVAHSWATPEPTPCIPPPLPVQNGTAICRPDGFTDGIRTNIQGFAYGAPRLNCAQMPLWCALARLQPSTWQLWGTGESTILVPHQHAFENLLERFPAFLGWLLSLPATTHYNRLETFLQLHSTTRDVSCQEVLEVGGPTRCLTVPSMDFAGGYDWLRFVVANLPADDRRCEHRVILEADRRRLTEDNSTSQEPPCTALLVDQACTFTLETAATVLESAMFLNGQVLLIDKVIEPVAHPLARFPTQTLLQYLAAQPDLSVFLSLLEATGAVEHMRDVMHLQYFTVFAPVNAAFGAVNLTAWLAPENRNATLAYLLSHIIPNAYLWQEALFPINRNYGHQTVISASTARVTVCGAGPNILSLRPGVGVTTGASADTISGCTNVELLDSILHKVSCLITPGVDSMRIDGEFAPGALSALMPPMEL